LYESPNMSQEPLLSVLVPTRNRVHTAAYVVRELAAVLDDDAEIVVQDCGQEGELVRALGELAGDRRLRYAHVAQKLSMTDNWNAGLARCRGRYLSVIGDDDGVHRSFGQLARWLERERIEAFVGYSPTQYHWPDFPVAAKAGRFSVLRHTADLRHCDPGLLLRALCRGFARHRDIEGLPMLYRGVVRRDVVEKMQVRPGVYFDGVTPDIYARSRLALLLREVVWADFPIMVPGASGPSNSGRFTAKAQGLPHLSEFRDPSWPAFAPVGLHPIIFCIEGLLLALENAGRHDLTKEIDFAWMYAFCLTYDRGRRLENVRRYYRASELAGSGPAHATAELGATFLRGALRRYVPKLFSPDDERDLPIYKIFSPGGDAPGLPVYKTYENLTDVAAAMQKLDEALSEQGVRPPWVSHNAAPARAATALPS
jgi:glycosyltransferase involved in cell wall biosynthesis